MISKRVAEPYPSLFVIAKLLQNNLIDIDEPIGNVLKGLPTNHSKTTIRQLAGHLGGIRHYDDMNELGNTHEYTTSAEALSIFIDDPLVGIPGESYSYSTYGYTLIRAVVEQVTGSNFLSLVEEQALEPLNLTETIPDRTSVEVPDRTEFYYLADDGSYIVGSPINVSYKWAGGGYLSTVVDLAKLGMAHLNQNILTRSTRDLLWTSQQTSSGQITGYGMGWFIYDDWVEHPGGALGGSTLLRVYPEEQRVVAIAANLSMRGNDRFGSLPGRLYECALAF